VKEKKNS